MKGKLESLDDDPAIGINSLRICIDPIIITKGDMNETALIRTHGRQLDDPMLTASTRGGGAGHGDDLIMTAALVAFNVNDDRISEAKLTTDQQRKENLEGLESASMPANEDSKVRRGDIKDQGSIVAIVLIDGGILGVEMREDGAKDRNRYISDCVELFISQLLSSLITSRKFRIITRIGAFGLSNLKKFIRHGILHIDKVPN